MKTAIPYARHYNPWFVYLFFAAVSVTDNLCTRQENSSIFGSKIRGLQLRGVSDQEQVIMLRVRYIVYAKAAKSLKVFSFCSERQMTNKNTKI